MILPLFFKKPLYYKTVASSYGVVRGTNELLDSVLSKKTHAGTFHDLHLRSWNPELPALFYKWKTGKKVKITKLIPRSLSELWKGGLVYLLCIWSGINKQIARAILG